MFIAVGPRLYFRFDDAYRAPDQPHGRAVAYRVPMSIVRVTAAECALARALALYALACAVRRSVRA
jgi:hypothetical protein